MSPLQSSFPELFDAIQKEQTRQKDGLELIASENYTSAAVLEAAQSRQTEIHAAREDVAILRALDVHALWSALGSAYQVWPVRWLEDRGYRWIANHRPLFTSLGDVPECEQPGAHC